MSAALLDDGRLHLQHGPIDLVIDAHGRGRAGALAAAAARFDGLLEQLVDELSDLRRPLGEGGRLKGPVARRMAAAVSPHGGAFITPMAAVAGAVADEILAAMAAGAELHKAYVNNGGDIAFHLTGDAVMRLGLVTGAPLPGAALDAFSEISAQDGVRGVATSGRHGRSFSLGLADAVTVLAASAADADAAATLIANAVTVESASVIRRPACELDPDSDLGTRQVTVAVEHLSDDEVAGALGEGVALAEDFAARGLIAAACLTLQGQSRITGSTGPMDNGGHIGDAFMQLRERA